MKNFYAIMLFCGFLLGIPLAAQETGTLAELLERKNKTTHLCVDSVFTPDEIALLRAHFGHDDVNTPVMARGPANLIFGIENLTTTYGNFDADDPSTFNGINTSPLSEFEGAGATDASGKMAYVVDNNNNLYQLVLLTGVYTFLGALTGVPSGHSITGLEFNPLDGLLYAISSDAVATSFLLINTLTVVATLIGVTGMVLGIALAANLAGNFFAVDIDSDTLWQINVITGLAVLIGAIGFDANFGQGMALSFLTGLVLIAAFNNTVFDSELRIVDLVTGLTTLIGIIIVGTLAQFGWIGNPDPNLGVGENTESGFEVYPNPASGSLFMRARDIIESISIYDMMGQRVLYQPVDALNSQVDISYLAAGQYVCTAVIDGQVGTYKLIKQ